jgi:hypothetical protein
MLAFEEKMVRWGFFLCWSKIWSKIFSKTEEKNFLVNICVKTTKKTIFKVKYAIIWKKTQRISRPLSTNVENQIFRSIWKKTISKNSCENINFLALRITQQYNLDMLNLSQFKFFWIFKKKRGVSYRRLSELFDR